MVRTDGPDGALRGYPIAYTFGVYPLQQYLITFPGRLQALGIAWDSRPKEQAASAGFPFTRAGSSSPAIRCIGPGATIPGATNLIGKRGSYDDREIPTYGAGVAGVLRLAAACVRDPRQRAPVLRAGGTATAGNRARVVHAG